MPESIAAIVERLQYRRGIASPQSMAVERAILWRLAQGKPVSAAQVANDMQQPVKLIKTFFKQLRSGGCEFDASGALVGMALSLKPSPHHFHVNEQHMYAWCALDTLFLPALLGETARVESTCPVTGKLISLTVAPDSVESISPSETVLSIIIGDCRKPGPGGDFCGQIFFFADEQAARQWAGDRGDVAIVSLEDAFTIAQQVYVY